MPDPWATLAAAADDRASGAAEIARRAAEALAVTDPERLEEAVGRLLDAHPSMAPLRRLGAEVLSAPDPAVGAARFLAQLDRDAVAPSVLAPHLPGRLVTISWSSAVLETVRLCRPMRVRCLRSDPGGEGERTAAAMGRWTDALVVADEEALRDVPGDAVLTGADAVTPAGVVNKVKTRALAEAAGAHGVPVYAVAGDTKFVAEPVPVVEPFELVPLELFTAIATPDGVLGPSAAGARARSIRPSPGRRRRGPSGSPSRTGPPPS